MEKRLIMRSFNVLDPAHDLISPHFLEASAGTGKTFAIEHIVVRLLLDETLKPKCDEILIVTFTRAATRELKMRIRHNLQRALEGLTGKEKGSLLPYLEEIVKEPQRCSNGIRILNEALCSFDQMQIFTIHGFCSQMVKAYPFDAGIRLQQVAPDDANYHSTIKQQILDFLRSGLKPTLFHKRQIQGVLKKTHHNLDKLVDRLLHLVNKEGDFPLVLHYEESLAKFKESIQELDQELFIKEKPLLEEFLSLAPLFKGISSIKKQPHKHFLEQVDILIECFADQDFLKKGFDKLLSYDAFFLEHFTELSLKKNSKISFHEIKQKSVFFALKDKIEPLLLEATDPLKTLIRMANLCRSRVHQVLSYYEMIPPDDLLKIMKNSVAKPSFCKKIQDKYKAAIIDEFQDTDPLQWTIFYTLFFKNRRSFPLFLVGDPKQSIYAFRNADLPTYLEASKVFSSEEHLSLDVNYRSEPGLIDALNGLFSASLEWLSEDGDLVYTNVKANPSASNTDFGDGYGSVHIFGVEELFKERQIPSKQIEEEFLFPFIAQEILKLRGQKVNLKNIAILIRDRFQGGRIESFLKKMNIPCLATSSSSLVETPAFNFLKILIKVMDRLDDLSLVKQLLAHPMMGFSHIDLKIDQKSEKVIEVIFKLKMLSKIYFEKGFLVFWNYFLQTIFYGEEGSFEERLLSQNDFQYYQDLNQLVQLLVEEHKYAYLSHEELLYVFDRLKEMDPDENEQIKRKIFSEEDAITIMTMHKSKGLEFGVVFALGICARSSFQEEVIKCEEEVVIFNNEDPKHNVVLKKNNQEKMRQFYVALTRAKQRVYIPMCFQKEKIEVSQSMLSPIELFLQHLGLSLGAHSSKEEVFRKLNSLEISGLTISDLNKEKKHSYVQDKEEKPFLCLPTIYNKRHQERYVGSYSSLAHQEGFSERSVKIIENPLLPTSAETGHLLHKVLEKIFERGFYISFDEEIIRHLIIQEMSISHLIGFEEEVFKIIEKVMKIRFETQEKSFYFKDIKPSHVFTEVEFLLEESSSLHLKGFMDLIFHYEDHYYLVDWKSNFLGSSKESYDQENLNVCMKENKYFIQADLYEKAFNTYLKRLGKKEENYGGIFYVFLRGLEEDSLRGVLHKK